MGHTYYELRRSDSYLFEPVPGSVNSYRMNRDVLEQFRRVIGEDPKMVGHSSSVSIYVIDNEKAAAVKLLFGGSAVMRRI